MTATRLEQEIAPAHSLLGAISFFIYKPTSQGFFRDTSPNHSAKRVSKKKPWLVGAALVCGQGRSARKHCATILHT